MAKLTYYIGERDLSAFAEQMIIAARRMTDPRGLRVRAPVPRAGLGYDEPKIMAVALKALSELIDAPVERIET